MPVVRRISIAPVKGLGLVHPESVLLEHYGVRENRRFHIVDADGRRFNQLRNGAFVQIRPEYDAESERLTLRSPDGSVRRRRGLARRRRSRPTSTVAPSSATTSKGPGPRRSPGGPGSRFASSSRRPGSRSTALAATCRLISTASLAELGREAEQGEPVDGRRFRMLFELDGCEPHEEDGWVKQQVRIGEAVISDPRRRRPLRDHDPESGDRHA